MCKPQWYVQERAIVLCAHLDCFVCGKVPCCLGWYFGRVNKLAAAFDDVDGVFNVMFFEARDPQKGSQFPEVFVLSASGTQHGVSSWLRG